jgi:hypothetical protein
MKAEFTPAGSLLVIAENHTESYALNKWYEENIDGCTLQFKAENPRCFWIITKPPKDKLLHIIKHKIELFLLNHKLIK